MELVLTHWFRGPPLQYIPSYSNLQQLTHMGLHAKNKVTNLGYTVVVLAHVFSDIPLCQVEDLTVTGTGRCSYDELIHSEFSSCN